MTFSHSKRAAMISAMSALVLAISACGNSSGTSEDDGGSATSASISWWSWSPDNVVANHEIAEFNKQFPDIKVTYKQVPSENYAAALRPALASNEGPDVYTVNASGAFSGQVMAPYAYDLTAAMEKQLGPDWKSKVYPEGPKAWTVDGRLIASEFAKQSAGILWINQDLFDKYDLEPPTTLAEWKSVCQTFRSNGVGCFRQGMSGSAGFELDLLHMITNNIQPGAWTEALNGTRPWNDPVFVQALETMQMLTTEKIMDEGALGFTQYPDVNNAFLSGKTAMVELGTWYAQNATKVVLDASLEGAGVSPSAKRMTVMPMTMPDLAGKGHPETIFSDPDTGQSVNAKSKNRNAAVTFALWLGTTPEGGQVVANTLEAVSTLNGVQPEWDKIDLVNPKVQLPAIKKITEQAEAATEPRAVGLGAQTLEALNNACQAVTGGKSPASVVDAIQQAAEQDKQGR